MACVLIGAISFLGSMEFYKHEVSVIREAGNTKPCLTNFHPGGQHDIDYFKMGQIVDVVAWDSYPYWGQKGDDVQVAAESSFDFDLMRGCAGPEALAPAVKAQPPQFLARNHRAKTR